MEHFTTDQKIALLVVPMILFTVLSAGVSVRGEGNGTEDDDTYGRKSLTRSASETETAWQKSLTDALVVGSYEQFEEAMEKSPYGGAANREVFSVLMHMRTLGGDGNSERAIRYFNEVLYDTPLV